MRSEALPDHQVWLRIADPGWRDPLDPSFAAARGGRWNPPGSHPTLYLNEDLATARLNLAGFVDGWPYGPEDLRDDTGPVLVHATLPPGQRAADAHTARGLAALGLPPTYPLDRDGHPIGHPPCQAIGVAVRNAGLQGVHARSARAPQGAGRELAWFPASAGDRARRRRTQPFSSWFWG
ncbi:MAG: RES family NAD+ phosphorylase [Thermoanaerobaculales bacterium]|jgi:hypothetical protein|nr:RES family NAD+ phosphorylase [Thermoanaerobaculales bacterium]